MLAPHDSGKELRPTSDDELREIVAEAVATKTPLAPVGQGTKSGIGRPVNQRALDLTALSGVVMYEPDELVLTVRAGTPVDDVVALLAEHGQELPFEPPMWARPDGTPSRGTIGGMVMTNFSGPRRIKVGAVRDHVLGLKGVSGRAEMFKAGGRVVKNVTGYDLARGLCGSWGTLAIATEVTFKVLPKAETERTVQVGVPDLAAAIGLMTAAMQTPFDVSGACCSKESLDILGKKFVYVLFRIEGFGPSVEVRVDGLIQFAKKYGSVVQVYIDSMSRGLWSGANHATIQATRNGKARWRVSIPPTSAVKLTETIRAGLPSADEPVKFEYDWSGGLVWITVPDSLPDLGAAVIRSAIAATGGGHATLIHGPADKRAVIEVFQPQAPALAALNARLKSQFDPMGILNPGRMVREA